MRSSLLQLIVGTIGAFIISAVVVTLFVREILQQSAVLDQQVAALQQDAAQQAKLTQLKRLIANTTTDRQALAEHYLLSQSDSIDFLNYIETLATDTGVSLQTNTASQETRDGQDVLTVQYDISSNRQTVEQFIQLLELAPYVSQVTMVQLSRKTPVTWQAGVTMEVIMLDYESIN